jgi:hypothetical protein
MTKKDYIAFAKIIKEVNNKVLRENAAKIVAKVCADDSVKFNKDRFIRACGL